MATGQARERLVALARRGIAHHRAGTIPLEPEVFRVPVSAYCDPDRWQREMQRIFKRVPLMLAFSGELRGPGSYRALTVLDTPVLVVRNADGVVRAFGNVCSHRGAMVVEDGNGQARRFTCPYHAWTYDIDGALVGLRDADVFGDIDRSCLGLTPLPTAERAGLIWVVLDPMSTIALDEFLFGLGEVLEGLGLAATYFVGRHTVTGPNWKVAFDGFVDTYHLPVLHKEIFGPGMSSRAIFDGWGPHQRISNPDRHFSSFADVPEDDWADADLDRGVWAIFPNVAIAPLQAYTTPDGAAEDGKMFIVSQIFPGPTVDTSLTVQSFLHVRPPAEQQPKVLAETMDFHRRLLEGEDYRVSSTAGRGMRSAMKKEIIFGRNEGSAHRFHRWVNALVESDDAELLALLSGGVGERHESLDADRGCL
jgi:phenylpropionate dioxygenase-like ring-hydroxylating dioxygenase large terminal subunit